MCRLHFVHRPWEKLKPLGLIEPPKSLGAKLSVMFEEFQGASNLALLIAERRQPLVHVASLIGTEIPYRQPVGISTHYIRNQE